ncbi:NAD(P)/FAD-dependent oxidoreductase [Nocardioides mesophilus]|uniref:FAD-dependent oxidoreductase n=1 Tax=Nocardioides mesophilus TaxID=433659 RepID=A0A7G9RC90_9ACTN|nr:FAD-dependent oxidoreductase [Nocardioides mesophilus]QNN53215.1 FAD-dependent oxidoreductase [Nocardioides mesophilus]
MTDSTQVSHADRPSVAVVGGGISGLTAAYLLQRTHHVTLFEAEDRVGGHAHTHDVETGAGTVPVDSGFIVLNDRTYPLLRRLFAELGVQTRPTEMSMSISCAGCGLSYKGGTGAGGIFAQRRRLLDPTFWRLLLSIRRFQKEALALLDGDREAAGSELTYGQFLDQHGFDQHFVTHYALPVVSCVWSMGHTDALAYPAAYLFAFLSHHGFLTLGDAPTWHTVVGGSRSYVRAVTERLDVVRVGAPVTAVSRKPDAVTVDTATGEHHGFDKVVLATHADTALALLTDAGEEEQQLLGSFGYSENTTWLHRDDSFLPELPRSRAAWNYRLEDCDTLTDRTRVTYWMNRLQGHAESDPLLVTLNPEDGATPSGVVATMTYAHPTYTAESVAAQSRLATLNTDRLAFAGAYQGWGFHEDGCRSGVRAAEALGATWAARETRQAP